jgi:hypothetical protein
MNVTEMIPIAKNHAVVITVITIKDAVAVAKEAVALVVEEEMDVAHEPYRDGPPLPLLEEVKF